MPIGAGGNLRYLPALKIWEEEEEEALMEEAAL